MNVLRAYRKMEYSVPTREDSIPEVDFAADGSRGGESLVATSLRGRRWCPKNQWTGDV